jgi:hypothetical protein
VGTTENAVAEALGRAHVALLADLWGWVDCVRRHEARENQLVQDAFNLDIGAED